MISNVELIGEYITVQSVEETYYNPEQRLFETRITPRANIISFTIINNYLEIWSNKTNANRLIFVLSSILQPISINSIEVSLKEIINKLQYQKVKISKVCFEDFLFTEDIVGNFTVDLSSYGEAFSVIQKYRDKIANMTIIFSYENAMLKLRLTSKGRITIYKARNTLDDEALLFLHNLLIAGGTN